MAISDSQAKLLLFNLVDKLQFYNEAIKRAVDGGGDGGDVSEAEEAGKEVDRYLKYIERLRK